MHPTASGPCIRCMRWMQSRATHQTTLFLCTSISQRCSRRALAAVLVMLTESSAVVESALVCGLARLVATIGLVQREHAAVACRACASDGRSRRRSALESCKVLVLKARGPYQTLPITGGKRRAATPTPRVNSGHRQANVVTPSIEIFWPKINKSPPKL